MPASEIKPTAKKKFASSEIGHVHIDGAELQLGEGKHDKFPAFAHISKFTDGKFCKAVGEIDGADFYAVSQADQGQGYEIH